MLTDLPVEPELFHAASGTAFADVVIDGLGETRPVRSTWFRAWLKAGVVQQAGFIIDGPLENHKGPFPSRSPFQLLPIRRRRQQRC
jgi:hypothetical protein